MNSSTKQKITDVENKLMVTGEWKGRGEGVGDGRESAGRCFYLMEQERMMSLFICYQLS